MKRLLTTLPFLLCPAAALACTPPPEGMEQDWGDCPSPFTLIGDFPVFTHTLGELTLDDTLDLTTTAEGLDLGIYFGPIDGKTHAGLTLGVNTRLDFSGVGVERSAYGLSADIRVGYDILDTPALHLNAFAEAGTRTIFGDDIWGAEARAGAGLGVDIRMADEVYLAIEQVESRTYGYLDMHAIADGTYSGKETETRIALRFRF